MIIIYLCGVAGFYLHSQSERDDKILESVYLGVVWPIIVFMSIARWTDV